MGETYGVPTEEFQEKVEGYRDEAERLDGAIVPPGEDGTMRRGFSRSVPSREPPPVTQSTSSAPPAASPEGSGRCFVRSVRVRSRLRLRGDKVTFRKGASTSEGE